MPRPLVLLAATVVLAAAAPDRPPAMPAHDASVTYLVQPAGQPPETVHVFFGNNGRLLRIDGPDGRGDTVLDRTDGTLTVVMNEQRAFMVVPSRGPVHDPFLLGDDMGFTRAGTEQTIAGVRCTDWRMTSPKGPSTACVTDDGLILAASGADGAGHEGRIMAESVSTAPVPPATFTPPAGFQRIAHPATSP